MRRVLAPALLAALTLTAACGSGSDTSTAGAEKAPAEADATGTVVEMPLLDFVPEAVKVVRGDTLTWRNGSNVEHVLVQGEYEVDDNGQRTSEKDSGLFDLKVAKKGDTVSHTFAEAGTYPYYCTIHKAMNGTVTVS